MVRNDRTVDFLRLNLYALIVFSATTAALCALYYLATGTGPGDVFSTALDAPFLVAASLLIGGIIVHELLHAFGFHYFAGVPWSEIQLGVKWKYATPFATTHVPMTARSYRWAAGLPAIVLGVLPAIVGMAISHSGFLAFAILMLGGAAGDLLIIGRMHGVPADALVRDSAETFGCEVVASNN